MGKFKVYTKTGDGGETSLFTGERRVKSDAVFAALGDVDELNASVGLASENLRDQGGAASSHLQPQLAEIQSRLLDCGSAIATPSDAASEHKRQRVAFDAQATTQLENWIDEMDESLPALTQFILPSGGKAAAQMHVARTVCRRAERAVLRLPHEALDKGVRIYMNRLSDYLFTAARFSAHKGGYEEVTYKKFS